MPKPNECIVKPNECIIEGCNEEQECNHCFKCQKHHDEEIGVENAIGSGQRGDYNALL